MHLHKRTSQAELLLCIRLVWVLIEFFWLYKLQIIRLLFSLTVFPGAQRLLRTLGVLISLNYLCVICITFLR